MLIVVVCLNVAAIAFGSFFIFSAIRTRERLPVEQRSGVAVGRLVLGILTIAIPVLVTIVGWLVIGLFESINF